MWGFVVELRYIFGDNDPHYADANALSEHLVGAEMRGNVPGNQKVGLQSKDGANIVAPKTGKTFYTFFGFFLVTL